METFDHIVLEDATTKDDNYTRNKIVQETGTGTDDITDVRIINVDLWYEYFTYNYNYK